MDAPPLEYLNSIPLHHNGDCSLIGVTSEFTIYVEEVYGEDGWLAQHAISTDGTRIESVDESFGTETGLEPLPLPDNLTESKRGWHTMVLNFSGPRHRGLRGPDRLDDLVRPFSIQEKMALVKLLELDIQPPQLLGLAESYVLAEAVVKPPNQFFICRRLRLAYALPETSEDETGEAYDYDTLVLFAAHFFDRTAEQEPTLSDVLQGVDKTPLYRPMDCMIYKDHLFIADGGSQDRQSVIHIWRILDIEPKLSRDENLRRKLYG